jgi:hypothetical protein
MTERLGHRLRRGGLAAGRLRVEATYADHTSVARAVPLRAAVLDAELWDAARHAFTLANAKRLAVRLVGVTVDRLEEAEAQLDLWIQNGAAGQVGSGAGRRADGQTGRNDASGLSSRGAPAARDRLEPASTPVEQIPRCVRLQTALDRVRTRYGSRALATARLPVLPPAHPS